MLHPLVALASYLLKNCVGDEHRQEVLRVRTYYPHRHADNIPFTILSPAMGVALIVGVATASHRLVKRDSTPFDYQLPSNASVIVGPITTGFDCTNLQYGYYADQANGCAVFHICYPYLDPLGIPHTRMFSFICGEGTIFDQSTLTCNFPAYALPCEAASGYYGINGYFNREDVQFRDGSVNNIF
ncbi:uncharacterized protein [Panulirus ornatus]|uniref:uncharacterized protein n=1 Tax=Panulirus ornatus TaxID=150431 RepID=UPI003A89081F